jgi:hypothetical protein
VFEYVVIKEYSNMFISRKDLLTIIREELDSVVSEFLCHSKEDGTFEKCKTGSVYSLTTKGADSRGVSRDLVKRGNVSGIGKDGKAKVAAKYGVNTSKDKAGGRKTLDGDDISPVRYVSKYPKKYYTEDLDESDDQGIKQKCRSAGYEKPEATLKRFLIRTSLASTAVKGDYPEKPSS